MVVAIFPEENGIGRAKLKSIYYLCRLEVLSWNLPMFSYGYRDFSIYHLIPLFLYDPHTYPHNPAAGGKRQEGA